MAHTTEICIYCGNTERADFTAREHVLPQSFGTFGSKTPTLRCVCDRCNAYFKKELDQLLARETLEGITRYKKDRFSRERRPQKELRFTLTESEEAGEFGGAIISGVDGTTGELLPPIAQFHAFNVKARRYDKFTKDQIRNLNLPDEIYGKRTERQYKIFAPSQEEHDAIVDELRKAGIAYREKGRIDPPSLLEGPAGQKAELEVQIEGIIDHAKKRAVAKILFNFATFHLGFSETSKPEWDKARYFVRYGATPLKARISTKPFWNGQETRHWRFEDDSYNLRIENLSGKVIGVAQFYNLFTYEFILVENYCLPAEQEVAYRFTPGEEPQPGLRITF